jgi:predicted PurR-regulated permease PerM
MAGDGENGLSAGQVGRRTLVVVAILALALFLWQAREAILLTFAAIVVALVLSTAAAPLQKRLGLPKPWALTVAGLLIIAALAAVFALVGAQALAQIGELGQRLPQAVRGFEARFNIDLVDEQAGQSLGRDVLQRLSVWGPTVLGALSSLVLVLVGGAFLAADPWSYREGLVKLFPPEQHRRVEETTQAAGFALQRWLLAQLMAMALVGVLMALGSWWIGLPAPLALGLFAALVEFVPIVGPVLGALPPLLLALSQGSDAVLWTLALVLAIQQIESNLITPLLQRRMVELPPALLLFSVLGFGLVFGSLGVILAAPLTVVAFVAAKKLWVRETLGEPTDVPGEKPEDKAS